LEQTGDCHFLAAYFLSDFGQNRGKTGNGQFIFSMGKAQGDAKEEN
jgi:hypothetical protein